MKKIESQDRSLASKRSGVEEDDDDAITTTPFVMRNRNYSTSQSLLHQCLCTCLFDINVLPLLLVNLCFLFHQVEKCLGVYLKTRTMFSCLATGTKKTAMMSMMMTTTFGRTRAWQREFHEDEYAYETENGEARFRHCSYDASSMRV